MNHHNELCDRVSDLSINSFTPLYVRGGTLIHIGFSMWVVKDRSTGLQQPNNTPLLPEDFEKNIDLLI